MPAEPIELIYSLVGYPSETEWIEFKESDGDYVRLDNAPVGCCPGR